MLSVVDFQKRSSFCGNPLVLDVRSSVEFKQKYLKGAVNIPLDELVSRKKDLEGFDGIYAYCLTGKRAARAVSQMKEMGFDFAESCEKGIDDLQAAGMEVVGSSAISVMRQVQMIAGSLVLLGVVGVYFVDEHFLFLSGFVGVGLFLAGATNTCMMATILEKMPWNK